jgi:NAD(P)-dependent dehydrogenase (short-subunit alcohol dehydrogenase family)
VISEFKGAKAVITGAANGIGKQLALGFAKRGTDLLLADIHGDEVAKTAVECEKFGVKTGSLQADVSLSEECGKIFDTALEELERIDILVNNAGVTALDFVTDIPEQDIKWVYETNVYSHWFMMQKFIPQMVKQGNHCQILNVCSIAGLMNTAFSPAYFSSKHAAVSLSECVYKQIEMNHWDIDLAVFCPGFIQTEMWKTDRHRPERFAIPEDDAYYKTERYGQMITDNKRVLDNGTPLEETIERLFNDLQKKQFYIYNTPQYERFLCEQGVFQAEKEVPIDYYKMN